MSFRILDSKSFITNATVSSFYFFVLTYFIDEVCPKSKKKTHLEGSLKTSINFPIKQK